MRIAAFLIILAATATGASAAERVAINDGDTIVIYGDSITEQNLYAAYLETFLISRFPAKALTIYNYGWSADNATNGGKRYPHDVLPVKPTLVFVDYGMNDGRYHAPDEGIRASYIAAERSLAGIIKDGGAREVLLTTSPIDGDRRPDGDIYNDALAAMASSLQALGGELGVPVIDQFTPLRALQRKVKAAHPGFTMIPDSVHPNEVGHLAMTYEILQGIEVPRAVGAATIDGDRGEGAGGVSVADVRRDAGALQFTLGLPFIPFYVPAPARPALELVPFAKDFNALTLSVRGLAATANYMLTVDGAEVAEYSGELLAKGVDIALCEKATWSIQGSQLWDEAQGRWRWHTQSWRNLGYMKDNLAKLPSFPAMRDSEAAFVREIGDVLRDLAQPKPYRLTLARQNRVELDHLDLSPLYPFTGDFAQHLPPETDAVAWQRTALPPDGLIDLLGPFPGATNCAVYARVRLTADAACTLRCSLGSDDGLAVFLDGERVFAHDVGRALKAEEDVVDIALSPGGRVLLMRVNQGVGGFGLGVKLRVLGDATVTAE